MYLYVGAGLDHDYKKIQLSNKNNRRMKTFYLHSDYEMTGKTVYLLNNNSIYDIGLIELEKPFDFSDQLNIYPACLLGLHLVDLFLF